MRNTNLIMRLLFFQNNSFQKNSIQRIGLWVFFVLFFICAPFANSIEAITETLEMKAVSDQAAALSVEQLKKKVIHLNRDLFILEEDLLFPANTQFVVYLSLNTGEFLQLDSVKLKVDDQIVAAHLYTERQVKALQQGGMQRLYLGNLKSGEHQVTVIVNGIGPNDLPYKRAASLTINKGTEIESLEVRIEDQPSNYQANIRIVEWN